MHTSPIWRLEAAQRKIRYICIQIWNIENHIMMSMLMGNEQWATNRQQAHTITLRTLRHFEKSCRPTRNKMTTTFTKYLMKNTSGTMITWIVQCPCIEICRANNNSKQHGVCNARTGDEETCTHFQAHL